MDELKYTWQAHPDPNMDVMRITLLEDVPLRVSNLVAGDYLVIGEGDGYRYYNCNGDELFGNVRNPLVRIRNSISDDRRRDKIKKLLQELS